MIGTHLLEILGCFVAVGSVAAATAAAGRLAGISLTAVASGLMAFLLPPVFSLRVESTAGIAALIVNGVAGLVVSHTVRPKRMAPSAKAAADAYRVRPPAATGPTLAATIPRVIEQDAVFRRRASDIHVHVDPDQVLPLPAADLDQILQDILRLALSPPNVRRVDIYSGRRPGESSFRLAAEYAGEPAVPHLKITGRTDDACVGVVLPGWPDTCSATWFDNGFDRIYQVHIKIEHSLFT